MMNGSSCDADTWISTPPGPGVVKSLPLFMFDEGFDVWMASNRGTKYGQEHITFNVNQPEFWDWTWADMGVGDDIANIKMIKEQTGKPKVTYIGMSQGTVQMFYALSKLEKEFLGESLHTFAAVDPCTIAVSEGDQMYEDGLLHFLEAGVYAFNGPNWGEDLKTICETFPADACEYAASQTGAAPVSVKTNIHWAQNSILNRFQEYAPNYNDGEEEAPLIDISSISIVPITLWSGLLD